jgi:hypothetical protein
VSLFIHLLRKFRPTLLAYPLLVLLQGKLLGFLPSNFEELLELLGKGEGVLVVRGFGVWPGSGFELRGESAAVVVEGRTC